MKDFKKGLSFGMGIVNAGQRAVSEEPELSLIHISEPTRP